MQTSPEVWVALPVDGPEDAVEEVLAAERVEVVEGAPEDEPVGEAHRVDQAGHLLEADALENGKINVLDRIDKLPFSTLCLSLLQDWD